MNTYLRIAASQFPVSHNLENNFEYIKMLIEDASKHSVEVIHFPETALPGYLNIPKDKPDSFDWDTLDIFTKAVCELALKFKIWIILGTIRKIKGELPKNCIMIISETGQIEGHYDKQRLYRTETGVYSSGDSPFVINIKGHKCGFLICYDNCYPELYTTYRELGAGLIFHSFHNAENEQETSIKNLMIANLLVRSADHQIWISASNSSKSYSPLPAAIARPDGSFQMGERHSTGILIEDYPKAELGWTYDNTKT